MNMTRGLQNISNAVLDLRAQCLPYMEGSKFSDFHLRKALSLEVEYSSVLQAFCKPCNNNKSQAV